MDHKKLKVLQWGAEEDLQKIVPRLYQDCGEWFLPRKRKGQEFISLRDLKTIWDAAKNRGPTDREVEWVRKFYRSYGFPYPVVARSRISEEVEKVRNTSVQDIFRQGKIIHNKRGLSLVNMLHQGLWSARTRSGKTYLEIFQDDTTLEKIIRDRFKHGNGLTPAQLLVGIRMRAKGPANYPPATAKAIYDKFLPNGGIVLDPCGGYGGRMLAALCSSQVNYHVSLEPATNTYRDTRMMLSILQKTVPQLNIRKAKLLNTTAEDYCPAEKEGFFDLVFTSPPYFNQEIYSDEPDQVSSTCKTLADYKVWIEKVSRNWIRMMKPGALLLLQVSDPVVLGLQRMPIVKQWTSVLNETPLVKHPALIYDSPGGRGARVTETLLHYQKPFTTKT
jgi:16S rRNA G966 N2-methylase RsmD